MGSSGFSMVVQHGQRMTVRGSGLGEGFLMKAAVRSGWAMKAVCEPSICSVTAFIRVAMNCWARGVQLGDDAADPGGVGECAVHEHERGLD
jgi:hypothetical protein